MRNLTRALLTICLMTPLTGNTQTHPYIRLTTGLSFALASHNQTANFSSSYWKSLVSNSDTDPALYGGLSAGLRIPLTATLAAEVGVGAYQAENYTPSGKVYQYSSPEFYNMNYRYNIHHQRLMLEGKLLATCATIYHPYISAGLGVSHNRSDTYQELPIQGFAVPDLPFSSASQNSLSYALGVGVDIDVTNHWRLGAGYELIDLGKTKLGGSPAQQTPQPIFTDRMKANQFMLQATYAS